MYKLFSKILTNNQCTAFLNKCQCQTFSVFTAEDAW